MASHEDLEKVKYLLRYNNWQHDPLSAAGYRGPTEPRAPENAIAARYDLHPWPKVGCVSRLDTHRSPRPGTTWDDLGRPGMTWDDLGYWMVLASLQRQTLHNRAARFFGHALAMFCLKFDPYWFVPSCDCSFFPTNCSYRDSWRWLSQPCPSMSISNVSDTNSKGQQIQVMSLCFLCSACDSKFCVMVFTLYSAKSNGCRTCLKMIVLSWRVLTTSRVDVPGSVADSCGLIRACISEWAQEKLAPKVRNRRGLPICTDPAFRL